MATAPTPPKPRQISPLIESAIGLAGLLLIAASYWWFFQSPLATSVSAANDEGKRLKQEELTVNQAFRAYQADVALLEEKRAHAKDWNRALPESAEMGPFLMQMNEQATAAGLKVKSVVPGEEKPQDFFTRVPVSLEVYGRFHQVARFFASVSHMDRIINVENIDIGNPVLNAEDQTILNVKCLTTTFHMTAPSASASASAGGPKK